MRPQPLKVLHFRQSRNNWGPEKGILGLCRALAKHGFDAEIAILYRRAPGGPAEHPMVSAARMQNTPITQVDGSLGAMPDTIRWLRDKLEREQFSILHCHEYKTDLIGALASWSRPAHSPALVATVRHTEPGIQMALFQALDSLVLHRFDRLTVPSEGAFGELKRWPALRRRSRVIHHSIEPFPMVSKTPAGLPAITGPVISIVGRLQEVKGHRIFLEAARRILATRPEAQFWIIGDGELQEELTAIASRSGVKHAVSFLGYRKDAWQLMALSDVVVCASQYEAFPRVALEALMLERPVAATAVGGIPEIVIDGETGLLVRSGDPEDLAQAVLRLLDDGELARRLASAGRRLVMERYSLEGHAVALATFYREALA
ncbi:MAG TPA: glycosyltransferase family 4 protein [Bryobacteraceae bacterium]|nr:glycosyltransferase family 4 protein [Bryobacteraceae bacterium]